MPRHIHFHGGQVAYRFAKEINYVAPSNRPSGSVLISLIFLLSGLSKLSAPAMTIGYIEAVGLPFPTLAFATALVVEIIGGLALVFGYQTRIVAAGLAVFSVATALSFHNDLADQNQFIHFFKNIAMAGGLLNVVAFGAGKFSIDGRRR
jgi:putative oxidoreductase